MKDVSREIGASEETYYHWKSKYGGMEAADVRRLKELEDDNNRLSRMYAALVLENMALRDVITEKLCDRTRSAVWPMR